jgi:DhnA family fructose-bisphosphate aldolase class Ia
VVGRNIWSEQNLEHAARAYAAVLHDGVSPNEAVAGA